jgi:methyl-accepting chemotaxis protein
MEIQMRFQTKLFTLSLSVIVVMTLLSIFLGLDFLRLANLSSQERAIERRTEATTRQFATTCEVALGSNDRKSLEHLAFAYRADADLTCLQVLNKSKQVFVEWGQCPSWSQLSASPEGTAFSSTPDVVAAWMPVESGGLRIGTVSLGYSLSRTHVVRGRIWLFAILVLLTAGLATIAGFVLSKRLTRPVGAMIHAFRRMAEGDIHQKPLDPRGGDDVGELARSFNELLASQQALGQTAMEVAKGNLRASINIQGDLADSIRLMIANQRQMVRQIAETAVQLTTAMTQFQSAAEQQERGAIEQSSAVEENQRTMESLLESARQVAETAHSVLQNAERTHHNNQLVAERIATLSSHTQRITEILQIIKEIANKSDLLALNAALEGTKAGEAGRGFSLVANQMQRLAENVVASVRDIKELTETIAEATRATVFATEESTKLAADTTRSARQIVLIVQQQQAGTEQMTKALDDVAQIARETTGGTKQIVSSSRDLVQLSARLHDLVRQFSIEDHATAGSLALPPG